jgi:hypothetical protein
MDIKTELDNFLGERRNLVEAIAREFRAGTPAKALARTVAPAFSRDQVTEYLAAVALHDRAKAALKTAGLGQTVDTRVTGISAPREALLVIAADPAETDDYPALAGRIRGALRDALITIGPRKEHDIDASTDGELDELLLDGELLCLIPLKPRT